MIFLNSHLHYYSIPLICLSHSLILIILMSTYSISSIFSISFSHIQYSISLIIHIDSLLSIISLYSYLIISLTSILFAHHIYEPIDFVIILILYLNSNPLIHLSLIYSPISHLISLYSYLN
jgi:hypothetical protein